MQADLNVILPEIVISVYAMAALLFAAYTGQGPDGGDAGLAHGGALCGDGAVDRGVTGGGTRTAFGGMFNDDGFARFAKVTILLSAAPCWCWGRNTWRARYPALRVSRCWWRLRSWA